jgi:hypothetical protein
MRRGLDGAMFTVVTKRRRNMRRLALTLVAASVVFGGSSLAMAQTTTTVVTQTAVATPSYYSDYYKAPYFKTAPSRGEMVQILANAGYTNPTGLEINSDVWTGTATMENHPVKIRFDRQGIWQLTK